MSQLAEFVRSARMLLEGGHSAAAMALAKAALDLAPDDPEAREVHAICTAALAERESAAQEAPAPGGDAPATPAPAPAEIDLARTSANPYATVELSTLGAPDGDDTDDGVLWPEVVQGPLEEPEATTPLPPAGHERATPAGDEAGSGSVGEAQPLDAPLDAARVEEARSVEAPRGETPAGEADDDVLGLGVVSSSAEESATVRTLADPEAMADMAHDALHDAIEVKEQVPDAERETFTTAEVKTVWPELERSEEAGGGGEAEPPEEKLRAIREHEFKEEHWADPLPAMEADAQQVIAPATEGAPPRMPAVEPPAEAAPAETPAPDSAATGAPAADAPAEPGSAAATAPEVSLFDPPSTPDANVVDSYLDDSPYRATALPETPPRTAETARAEPGRAESVPGATPFVAADVAAPVPVVAEAPASGEASRVPAAEVAPEPVEPEPVKPESVARVPIPASPSETPATEARPAPPPVVDRPPAASHESLAPTSPLATPPVATPPAAAALPLPVERAVPPEPKRAPVTLPPRNNEEAGSRGLAWIGIGAVALVLGVIVTAALSLRGGGTDPVPPARAPKERPPVGAPKQKKGDVTPDASTPSANPEPVATPADPVAATPAPPATPEPTPAATPSPEPDATETPAPAATKGAEDDWARRHDEEMKRLAEQDGSAEDGDQESLIAAAEKKVDDLKRELRTSHGPGLVPPTQEELEQQRELEEELKAAEEELARLRGE